MSSPARELDRPRPVDGEAGLGPVVPQALRENPFFQEFGPELASTIAGDVVLERVEDGACLIELGHCGGDLFVVEEGRAVVELPVEGVTQRVAEAGRGCLLGEVSVIRGTPHSARVVAEDGLMVWRIPRDIFRDLVENDCCWAKALLLFEAERLQNTTANLAYVSFAADKVVSDEFAPELFAHIRNQPAGMGLFADTFESMARFVTERAQRLEAEVEARTRALSAEIRKREQAERDLRRLAATDPLTGASNRRHFFEEGARELQRARRSGRPLALMHLDLDHFKRINDTYGHAAGDLVLKEVVACCRRQLRGTDLLGRLGGEEFAVLVPECPPCAAGQLAERVREGIAAMRVATDTGEVACTTSIGVAACDPELGLEVSLEKADRALYRAKQSGRNRVVMAEPD